MKDAVNSEDEATNMKLYAVCDLAMGIILTRNIIDVAEYVNQLRTLHSVADPDCFNFLPLDQDLNFYFSPPEWKFWQKTAKTGDLKNFQIS